MHVYFIYALTMASRFVLLTCFDPQQMREREREREHIMGLEVNFLSHHFSSQGNMICAFSILNRDSDSSGNDILERTNDPPRARSFIGRNCIKMSRVNDLHKKIAASQFLIPIL